MFCNVQWAGKFWSHWMNLRLRKGNLLIYMTAVRYHCRRNFKCMMSLNKSAKGETEAGALCWQQISNQAWTRLQLTMVFLIGEHKLTTWFETLLTDSQVKKNTVSCVSSEKTGRTLLNKIAYDKNSATRWFNTNDVMFFNIHRANFLDQVMLLITKLFPENVSSLVSRNSLEQCVETTVLETRSAEKRNLSAEVLWRELWRRKPLVHTITIWMIRRNYYFNYQTLILIVILMENGKSFVKQYIHYMPFD